MCTWILNKCQVFNMLLYDAQHYMKPNGTGAGNGGSPVTQSTYYWTTYFLVIFCTWDRKSRKHFFPSLIAKIKQQSKSLTICCPFITSAIYWLRQLPYSALRYDPPIVLRAEHVSSVSTVLLLLCSLSCPCFTNAFASELMWCMIAKCYFSLGI